MGFPYYCLPVISSGVLPVAECGRMSPNYDESIKTVLCRQNAGVLRIQWWCTLSTGLGCQTRLCLSAHKSSMKRRTTNGLNMVFNSLFYPPSDWSDLWDHSGTKICQASEGCLSAIFWTSGCQIQPSIKIAASTSLSTKPMVTSGGYMSPTSFQQAEQASGHSCFSCSLRPKHSEYW